MKTLTDIRNEFLGYFEKNGHEHVESAPLVPQNDPTLMFVNSGMVPFKNCFTGVEKRPYSRATTAQKSVRAGGKHNDLDNVGYTARHHTFFEMLGNFSFGDYFKEEAISYAWELVSKNFTLPKDHLLVTVHSTDEEAADLWKKIAGFSDDKIIRIPTDDNFWRMGDTGPCGPCTEIFFDQGEGVAGGPPGSPDEDGDRFLEFWNLVFMQYEQVDADTRIDLPSQSIDTGMGLERIAAILQGKTSNYDTDLFQTIIKHITDLTGETETASHRVIADHLRCSAFLIADGVMPSNEGRGYVLRRIMRRGMRHAHLLGAQDPLMYKLLPTLNGLMGEAYPELIRAESLIKQTLENEETKFKTTLERGLKILDEETENMSGKTLDGAVAFKLYDTYGFPLDLTQDALKSKRLSVDVAGFNALMEAQKVQARKNWAGSGQEATEKVWFEILEEHEPTEFLGYNTEKSSAYIQEIIVDGVRRKKGGGAHKGENVIIITNQTPFYAESGGQVGDTGIIKTQQGEVKVTDTQKILGKLWAHIGSVSEGLICLEDEATLQVDNTRRTAIRANHSATHLLHEALRQKLGDHVAQKGSLQDADRTRFDISHPKAITKDELASIEQMVAQEISADTPIETKIMDLEAARESGARALFGEKYDDEVRVVSMGTQNGEQKFSVELCGGTHAKSTGEIGKFKIISESALSSGVRRIEAITGQRVDAYEQEQKNKADAEIARLQNLNQTLREELKSLGGTAPETTDDLEKQNKQLQKQISDLRRKTAASETSDQDIEDIGGIHFISRVLENFPPQDLKPMIDTLKSQHPSSVITLIATNDDKASVVIGVTADLTDKYNAVDLVRKASEALGGKGGGGRPDMAQAGGNDPSKASSAIQTIKDMIQ